MRGTHLRGADFDDIKTDNFLKDHFFLFTDILSSLQKFYTDL